jgi:Fe-S cluster biogenesis protein NfuA
MSEALDKFFGSKLDLPAANSTVNKAIQNQLKTNGDRVSEVIHKSLIEQGQSVEKVAQELTKEGFDESSAKTLAQEVHKRLASQFSEAKKAKLEQLMKDAPQREEGLLT